MDIKKEIVRYTTVGKNGGELVASDNGEFVSYASHLCRLEEAEQERDALRAELQKARDQEPIYMWRLEDDGWMECTKEWFDSDISSGYEKRIVYAHPVPAMPITKQDPAGAVPDELILAAQSILDNDGGKGSKCFDPFELTKARNKMFDILASHNQSPRITEQDAREILRSYCGYWEETDRADTWLDQIGRDLLNKLN